MTIPTDRRESEGIMAKSTIWVEGQTYAVTENIGFDFAMGGYVKFVQMPDGKERPAVRMKGSDVWNWHKAKLLLSTQRADIHPSHTPSDCKG